MANIFNSIPLVAPKRNFFNLSHDVKLTCEMGELIPIFCEPVLPSDRLKISTSQLVRFSPLQAPIYSNIDVYVHFFFVPNRLIWNNWETFITGSKNGKKLADEEVPDPPFSMLRSDMFDQQVTEVMGSDFNFIANPDYKILENRSLADYLGFQTYSAAQLKMISDRNSLNSYPIDELPFRAYQRIWFDYYRDENLSPTDSYEDLYFEHDGEEYLDTASHLASFYNLFALRRRAWRKDYFTSALPWAQKGDDVLIPHGDTDIKGSSNQRGVFALSQYPNTFSFEDFSHNFADGTCLPKGQLGLCKDSPKGVYIYSGDGDSTVNIGLKSSSFKTEIPYNQIASGLSLETANEATIRELRRAFAAQKFLERRAIGGTRYNETILAFFGIKTSDGRLQRAEFLGGSKQPVVISQILQTSESTDASPLGQPGGTAVSAGGKYIFDKTFEEYGFVIGIMSVLPRADYMQGIPRKYLKRDVYDYYWPQFARIGEQDIKNAELYFDMQQTLDKNLDAFGYTPRYAEYRFINNSIHGDFKDTLSFWHLARNFDKIPTLNTNFVAADPSKRIFAYEGNDFSHLWCDIHLNVRSIRPLPKYAESI